MVSLIVLIGPPGAGKSTFAAACGGTVVSTDAIRRQLYGGESSTRCEPVAQQLLRKKHICTDGLDAAQLAALKESLCVDHVFDVARDMCCRLLAEGKTSSTILRISNANTDGSCWKRQTGCIAGVTPIFWIFPWKSAWCAMPLGSAGNRRTSLPRFAPVWIHLPMKRALTTSTGSMNLAASAGFPTNNIRMERVFT